MGSWFLVLRRWHDAGRPAVIMSRSAYFIVDRPTLLCYPAPGAFLHPLAMDSDLKDLILNTIESSLDAQLRAVRRLRTDPPPARSPSPPRLSQVNMTFDILKSARSPLYVSELIDRIQARFSVSVDRESLVSSLSKKIARGDRFIRTAKNTFALRKPAADASSKPSSETESSSRKESP